MKTDIAIDGIIHDIKLLASHELQSELRYYKDCKIKLLCSTQPNPTRHANWSTVCKVKPNNFIPQI
ncbi:hypothetical protein GBA52_009766 [Prunus armeniaca]|nr:hypothetical protein GBA52_009766 [Prunus armeniaca]